MIFDAYWNKKVIIVHFFDILPSHYHWLLMCRFLQTAKTKDACKLSWMLLRTKHQSERVVQKQIRRRKEVTAFPQLTLTQCACDESSDDKTCCLPAKSVALVYCSSMVVNEMVHAWLHKQRSCKVRMLCSERCWVTDGLPWMHYACLLWGQ